MTEKDSHNSIRRVAPKNQPKMRLASYQQCQWPLAEMSASADTVYSDGTSWRFNRRSTRRFGDRDPNFCFLDAHVEIDGKVYCSKHAGVIALEFLLGERELEGVKICRTTKTKTTVKAEADRSSG